MLEMFLYICLYLYKLDLLSSESMWKSKNNLIAGLIANFQWDEWNWIVAIEFDSFCIA